MFLKKSKSLIYILICLFVLGFIIPTYSFGINEDSIYVWSDNSDSISTSSPLTPQGTTESSQNNSR